MASNSNQSKPKILIIGGGIAGLTLGQALLQHGIPFRIFERDHASSFRAQGYRIRVSGDGVLALQKCLPPALWEKFEASCATTVLGLTKLDAITGEEDLSQRPGPQGPSGRPSIGPTRELRGMNMDIKPVTVDRTIMRAVLLTGLEKYIDFGKELQRYEITPTGITAHFTDGSSSEGDFLVGADGIRSNVRKQYLPELALVDTDGRCIYGKTFINEELSSNLSPKAQKNMTMIQEILEDGTPFTLFMEPIHFPNPDLVPIPNTQTGEKEGAKDYLYWVLVSRSHVFPPPVAELLRLNPKETAELSIQMTQKWHPDLTPILTKQALLGSCLRVTSAVPNMPSWTPSSRLTILGDAAHPMSPTGGLGAVSALIDVGKLVDVIISDEGITEERIGAFEEGMRKWAGEAIEGSRLGGAKLFGQVEWKDAKPVKF